MAVARIKAHSYLVDVSILRDRKITSTHECRMMLSAVKSFTQQTIAYQGCRAACSQVYLLLGSFSIKFRMKSLAVKKENNLKQ